MSEPWLGGPLPGVDPMLAPLLYTFRQTREELAHCTEGLTASRIWERPCGITPLGFHIRHIAGSVDRLCTYLEGSQLSDAQRNALAAEPEPGASRDELLSALDASLSRCEAVVRALDPAQLREPREVGRARLPSTVIGLLVHIAEHTQRHLGQAVTTAKLLGK